VTEPAQPFFSIAVEDPDLKSVRNLRHGLRDALKTTDIPSRLAQDLLLAVQEHATNLIRHGDPKPNRIELSATVEGGSWSVRIEDDGGAFASFDAYMALATLADRRSDPRTHGMGLKFIGTRFADHRYRAGLGDGERNSLSLHFPPRASEITRPLIVLLEDSNPLRRLIKEILSTEFRVIDFALPSRALRIVRSHPPDLILCDIGLPEMDGMAFRRELGQDVDTDIVPFAFLSAHSDEQTLEAANQLGIDDFVVKPPNPRALLRMARRLITRSRRLREAMIAKTAKEFSAAVMINVPSRIGRFRIGFGSESPAIGGGDLIQTAPIGSTTVLFLADVMGHGLAARFYAHGVAAYFRSILAAAVDQEDGEVPGIDQLMTQVSNAILADPTFEQTVVSAQIVALHEDGRIDVCSAGHPFPVLTSGQGSRFVETSGPLLALAPDLPFPSVGLRLGPGERLALYTDGLSEIAALRRDPARSAARLFGLLESAADAPADKAALAVLEAHKRETGTLGDDTTLLLIAEHG